MRALLFASAIALAGCSQILGIDHFTNTDEDAAVADAPSSTDGSEIDAVMVIDSDVVPDAPICNAGQPADLDLSLGRLPSAVPGATPQADLHDNGNGTVTDNVTGLVWEQAYYPTDSATSATYGQQDASNYCSTLTLAGKTWRLPSLIELMSIADTTAPPINQTYFPGTPAQYFWSSTSGAVSCGAGYDFIVSFDYGYPNCAKAGDRAAHARCVEATPRTGANSEACRYDVAADTVLDKITNLTWQRHADTTKYTFDDAKTHCSTLTLAGGGWRSPTYRELMTLLDLARSPALTPSAFAGESQDYYWSSDSWPPQPQDVGDMVGFFESSSALGKTNVLNVRCVR